MTLQQMASLKRWHVTHRHTGWLEYQAWDLMLMLWVLGWVGLPPATWLAPLAAPWMCLAFIAAPSLYVHWRVRLHRHGRVRCDWLGAVAASPMRG